MPEAISELDCDRLAGGQYGCILIDDGALHTGSFGRIVSLADGTVVETVTGDGMDDYDVNITLNKGREIKGPIDSVEITLGGSLIAYYRE